MITPIPPTLTPPFAGLAGSQYRLCAGRDGGGVFLIRKAQADASTAARAPSGRSRLSYLMAPRLRPLLTPPNDGTTRRTGSTYEWGWKKEQVRSCETLD